ncbi:MAG TPA: FAD-dependent oxidoreductase, partial [Abditibacteriaceae bacterium]|nr:FAD-dependent oxidoreductase [Abditibacteriaceae bacterium]
MNNYDLVVIGAGTGGLVSAVGAKALGANVVLIERERVGGECLWTGCVPSKTLIKSARVFETINRAAEFGVHIEKPKLVWNAVKLRIKDVRDEIKKLEREELQKANLEVITGEASFVDANTLRVVGKNGEQTICAKKFILATGSKPNIPDVEGLRETGFITYADVYDLPNLPRSLITLGGGAVACEMAQALARFGTKVTILQQGERLLPKEDKEVSQATYRILEQSGVVVHLNAKAVRAGRGEDRAWIEFEKDNQTQRVEGSRIMIAAGKIVDTSSLKLSAIGVQSDARGVVVDEHLRTTVPNIWACGDVTGSLLFTHVAEAQAKIAVQNALLPLKARWDARVVPWTTFLDPEIAHLGLTEEEARIEYSNVKVYRQHFKTLDRAIIEGETEGFLKVVCSPAGRVLGAHIVGANAGELIHNWIAAVRDGALIEEFGEAIHVYPTLSEIGHRVGNASYQELLESRTVKWALKK